MSHPSTNHSNPIARWQRALQIGAGTLVLALLLTAGWVGTSAPLSDFTPTTTTAFVHSPSGRVAVVPDLTCEQRLIEVELDSMEWPATASVGGLDQVYQDLSNVMFGLFDCPAAIQGAIQSIKCNWLLTTPWLGDRHYTRAFEVLQSSCPI